MKPDRSVFFDQVVLLVEDIDATDGSVCAWPFFWTSHTLKVHAEPVVVRTPVGADSQAVVVEVNPAELLEPVANLANGRPTQ